MRTTLPQGYCPDATDHPAHIEYRVGHADFYGDAVRFVPRFRCPGRHTPSAHRMPGIEPAQPSDPFTGIDENTEADARRPAVS